MDETLKLKIRKVAIAYFCISLFVLWKAIDYAGWEAPVTQHIGRMVWRHFWLETLVVLQPLWLLINPLSNYPALIGWLISIPLWSVCLGWLFVKLDNWLNHFPVLGKRVF